MAEVNHNSSLTPSKVGAMLLEDGGDWQDSAPDALGRTMFDLPNSEDDSITVLLPRDSRDQVPSQSLLRIKSSDGHTYIGVVVAGPFAEPDGLRGDNGIMITTTVKGGIFMPQYHCRCLVEIMGEELDGTLQPPSFRPLPNSPVYRLSEAETTALLHSGGDIRLGLAAGHEGVEVGIPADKKSVLPRHTGIFGTTGGGKSTTVARLIAEAQQAGFAVVLLDVEGEYTYINQPTEDDTMLSALAKRGWAAQGIRDTTLYHLVGRDTTNPDHPHLRSFSLKLESISPYTLAELAELNEAQSSRFWGAYTVARTLMQRLGIFPRKGIDANADAKRLLALDEFTDGYPNLTLAMLYDVIVACSSAVARVESEPDDQPYISSPLLRSRENYAVLQELVASKVKSKALEGNQPSWRALQSRIATLVRARVFDQAADRVDLDTMLAPGQVSIFDLSDTNSTTISNLVIADLLRAIQERQDEYYRDYEKGARLSLPKVMIIIEEAHEFLARRRASEMNLLFEQVARIAKRGRKRWLSLVFVSQLPQHLPDELFGLINNYILHKINDASTISRLQRVITGMDEATWRRMPALAPGQAVVSLTSMTRPLLTRINPAPCKLRMID